MCRSMKCLSDRLSKRSHMQWYQLNQSNRRRFLTVLCCIGKSGYVNTWYSLPCVKGQSYSLNFFFFGLTNLRYLQMDITNLIQTKVSTLIGAQINKTNWVNQTEEFTIDLKFNIIDVRVKSQLIFLHKPVRSRLKKKTIKHHSKALQSFYIEVLSNFVQILCH